jgi:signal transduction histidine kinase
MHADADVLNVSKLNAGLVTIVNADFVPCEEVKNAVRMFKEEVAARDIQLHFEQDDSIDILQIDWVRGDSGRFFQVIVNLINNAIKFTEPAPRRIIRIRIGGAPAPEEPTEDDEGVWPEMDQEDLLPMCRQEPLLPPAMKDKLRLYLAVADSGLGMTDEEQAHLSRSFAQASPRTYGDFGRSGIGLVSLPLGEALRMSIC